MSKRKNLHLMCLLLTLGLAVSITGCSGWSIMGYSLDENQEDKLRVLSTITDNKGVEHFYNGAIHSGENWCYNHNQYETVEIK